MILSVNLRKVPVNTGTQSIGERHRDAAQRRLSLGKVGNLESGRNGHGDFPYHVTSLMIPAESGLFPRDVSFLSDETRDRMPVAWMRPGINTVIVRYSEGWREIHQPLRISWRTAMKRHDHA